MTVGELAEQLKNFKPTMEVLVLHAGDGIERHFDIEMPGVKASKRKDWAVIPVAEHKS